MTRRYRHGPAGGGPLRAAALIGAVLWAVAPATAADGAGGGPQAAARQVVCVRDTCFDAEIAVTAEERGRGLMHREALPGDRGMLFVFPEEGRHAFWMKNTLIELDILFIAADLRLVGIARRAQPCRKDPCEHYAPEGEIAYALEIAGGLADRHGFAKGDRVEFRAPAAGP